MNARTKFILSFATFLLIHSITIAESSNTDEISTPKKYTNDWVGRRRASKHAKGKKKTFNTMSYEELKKSKEWHITHNNKDVAITYIERMLRLCDNVTEISGLMLELADLFFDVGNLDKAETMYTEFSHLYPGHEKTEYALYRAIICAFYSTLSIDRDQTKTTDTIALADTFLARDVFTHYTAEVAAIQQQCYQKIIESELYVCQFYLNTNNVKAVELRLNDIRAQWINKVPAMELPVLMCECQLAEKQHNDVRVQEKQLQIAQHTKQYKPTMVTAQAQTKTNFVQRF